MRLPVPFLQNMMGDLEASCSSVFHAVMPGQILSYDASSGLAEVQPALSRRSSSGSVIRMPVLSGVPVMLPSLDHPVSPGDRDCLRREPGHRQQMGEGRNPEYRVG